MLASGFEDDLAAGALPIRQDARVLGGALLAGARAHYEPGAARNVYLVVSKGEALVNGERLGPRDGAALTGEASVSIEAVADSEIVLVDAP